MTGATRYRLEAGSIDEAIQIALAELNPDENTKAVIIQTMVNEDDLDAYVDPNSTAESRAEAAAEADAETEGEAEADAEARAEFDGAESEAPEVSQARRFELLNLNGG